MAQSELFINNLNDVLKSTLYEYFIESKKYVHTKNMI